MRSKATYSIRTNGDYFPETFTDIQKARSFAKRMASVCTGRVFVVQQSCGTVLAAVEMLPGRKNAKWS